MLIFRSFFAEFSLIVFSVSARFFAHCFLSFCSVFRSFFVQFNFITLWQVLKKVWPNFSFFFNRWKGADGVQKPTYDKEGKISRECKCIISHARRFFRWWCTPYSCTKLIITPGMQFQKDLLACRKLLQINFRFFSKILDEFLGYFESIWSPFWIYFCIF